MTIVATPTCVVRGRHLVCWCLNSSVTCGTVRSSQEVDVSLSHSAVLHYIDLGNSLTQGNGLSPAWHQAITWTKAHLLSIGPLGTNFSEIWIKIQNFSLIKNAFENVVCEMAAILPEGDELKSPDISWHSQVGICHSGLGATNAILG